MYLPMPMFFQTEVTPMQWFLNKSKGLSFLLWIIKLVARKKWLQVATSDNVCVGQRCRLGTRGSYEGLCEATCC